ncbi:hypothetical protein NUW54_g12676 [Trametes sanguinea]|uniref:Uncharacterized protein n=1 Tax=Trametes sanguinea TaxID=158606 RepID=A0ACC1MUK6_9APHY|nr:hypothetical protein NUW54_g12676 [Trametes sanguinea]
MWIIIVYGTFPRSLKVSAHFGTGACSGSALDFCFVLTALAIRTIIQTRWSTVCTDCGGTVIEYDAAAGNGFCVNCGTVVEENTIVNEVTFGETSTGAAMVQGTFVAQGATRARMGGMFGNRGNSESREQTIANASRKIQQVATVLRLSEVVALAATRLYTLAVEHKFTKGRKSMNVVAVCLYVACRQKETRNYMLIDFSDLLQVCPIQHALVHELTVPPKG